MDKRGTQIIHPFLKAKVTMAEEKAERINGIIRQTSVFQLTVWEMLLKLYRELSGFPGVIQREDKMPDAAPKYMEEVTVTYDFSMSDFGHVNKMLDYKLNMLTKTEKLWSAYLTCLQTIQSSIENVLFKLEEVWKTCEARGVIEKVRTAENVYGKENKDYWPVIKPIADDLLENDSRGVLYYGKFLYRLSRELLEQDSNILRKEYRKIENWERDKLEYQLATLRKIEEKIKGPVLGVTGCRSN